MKSHKKIRDKEFFDKLKVLVKKRDLFLMSQSFYQ